jgi:hypothetical protein
MGKNFKGGKKHKKGAKNSQPFNRAKLSVPSATLKSPVNAPPIVKLVKYAVPLFVIDVIDKILVQEKINGLLFIVNKETKLPRTYYYFKKEAILKIA